MPKAQLHFIIPNYWHFFKRLKAAPYEFLKLWFQRLSVRNKTALIPPKVNHRSRGSNGLRDWMVAFLRGVGGRKAAKRQQSNRNAVHTAQYSQQVYTNW